MYSKVEETKSYQALQDVSVVAAPVVLSRFERKKEEWQCTQREWSHRWRQVELRNFHKSLDHAGINFKQNGKMITTNTFVGEIESLRTEQERQQQQQQTQEEDWARGWLGFQLVFVC